MGKKLAIEHHLIRPNEVIELLEMMGGKNKDNADGCSFLYYTLCTPKTNNPNNEKVICGFTNLKMQNDFFDIFTLERFWKKYPYKLNDKVLCDDGLLGVVTKMEWDCEKSDMKYYISFKIPVDNKWYSSKNIICKYIEAMEAIRKKLAIKGHPTRGKEVIELLEMLGGINDEGHIGTNTWKDVYYYLDNGHIRAYDWCDAIKFTLEGFWEKYPFKVGDKVIDEADGCPGVVCEMKWDEYLSDMKYCVAFGNGIDFGWYASDSIEKYVKDMKKDNTALEPEELESSAIKIVDGKIVDGLEKIHKLGPKSKLSPQYYEKTDTPKAPILSNREDYAEGKFGYVIPNGYEFDSIKDNQIIIRPIKPKYPKTYVECCEVIANSKPYAMNEHYADVNKLLQTFQTLFICRNAYWKIAGEQMGLDKPWEPDWTNLDQLKYCIMVDVGEFITTSKIRGQEFLNFPTEEMRDAFYENFKNEIEQCKELL